jgi:hypothetical protein
LIEELGKLSLLLLLVVAVVVQLALNSAMAHSQGWFDEYY